MNDAILITDSPPVASTNLRQALNKKKNNSGKNCDLCPGQNLSQFVSPRDFFRGNKSDKRN